MTTGETKECPAKGANILQTAMWDCSETLNVFVSLKNKNPPQKRQNVKIKDEQIKGIS